MLSFIPYKSGSAGVKAIREYLTEEMDTPDHNTIKPMNFDYHHFLSNYGGPNKKRLLVCWGNVPGITLGHGGAINNDLNKNKMLNPGASAATNKKIFFEQLALHNFQYLPPFTKSPAQAESWLASGSGRKVLCRTKLSSHSGEGIVIAETPEQLVAAQLYVYYIKKKSEYRAHINKFNDDIVWQEKRLKSNYDVENPNIHTIRNHHNGWVYCRSQVNPPQAVKDAVLSLKNNPAYTLDFSAVDIIYNQQQDRAYVLEANTAPGLCGGTVVYYANLFNDWHEQVKNS